MSSKTFKLSAIAATVFTALSANAAIYNVTQYAPEGTNVDTYGVAIQQSASGESCWDSGSTCPTSDVIAETQKNPQGFDYRDEAPFFLRYGFDYLDDGQDGFETYCYRFLGYTDSICDDWASEQWQGYSYERAGNYDNVIAYSQPIDPSNPLFSENTAVNAYNQDGTIIGNVRDGSTSRNRAFVGGSLLDDDVYTDSDFEASHAWAQVSDGSNTYTVGSVSRDNSTRSNTTSSKATIWVNSTAHEINWVSASADGWVIPQGSARDIVVDGSTIYAVGYNSNDEERLIASVFTSTDSGSTWSNRFVSNFRYDVEDDYANSVLTSVNENNVAIGTAKMNEARNGAYANTLFYVPNVASPRYTEFSGSIFFSGANGKAGAINNFNEVVGTIDYETHREINGNPRAQRGFIAPLSISGSANGPRDVFSNTAYYLDDLTNDGSASSSNNQYRIFEASDINDAGIISGTAYYCAGGYDTTAIDSPCSGNEAVVAVKLTPIADATNADIQTRPQTEVTVSRKGGSLNWMLLTILGFIRFRKK